MNDVYKAVPKVLELSKSYKDLQHLTILDVESILNIFVNIGGYSDSELDEKYHEGYEDGYETARENAMKIVDEVRWM